LLPDYSIQSHPKIDVLLVVGGVHTNEMLKPDVLDWIKSVDQHAQVVASVCTGAFLLANAGLLKGLSVTTHWEDIADLKAQFSDLKVADNKRWVQSGKYITSGGISAGIDMSLHLVSQLTTKVSAEKVAHQMEYNWQKNVE
jgi:transcriptional regulator GlxA family with amidase domain